MRATTGAIAVRTHCSIGGDGLFPAATDITSGRLPGQRLGLHHQRLVHELRL
jgi:hypothetical protein